MIPLLEALNRIVTSTATNEGPDAQCVGADTPEGQDLQPYSVQNMGRALVAAGGVGITFRGIRPRLFSTTPVQVVRKLRNWKIVGEDGQDLLKQHPWDSTPNIADLRAKSDPAHIESLIEFSNRVQALANEAERLRQFIIAMNLWQMVSVINDFTKQPVANAIGEATRLAQIVAALTGQPVQTTQQKPNA